MRILPLLVAASLLPAQDGWRIPPEPILQVLTAPPPPGASVSPDGKYLLLLEREAMPALELLAREVWKLAGLRLDPRNHGPQQFGRVPAVRILEIATRKERRLELPAHADVGGIRWTPDSSRFAFTNTQDDRIELCIADPATGSVKTVPGLVLNATLASPFRWLPDQRRLLAFAAVSGATLPERPSVPEGPHVEVADGTKAAVRTFQDLLRDRHDAARLRWIATSQMVVVDAAEATLKPIGQAAMWSGVDPAPGGEFLLASEIREPFSYRVPVRSFARRLSVLRMDGTVVRRHVDLPAQENVPIGGVTDQPRNHGWLPSEEATLIWVQALDGGDPRRKVPFRDQILMSAAPFEDAPIEWRRLEHRFRGLQFAPGGEFALLSDYDRDTRRQRTWRVQPGAAEDALLFDRSTQDAYGDPGRPVMEVDPRGEAVLMLAQDEIFLAGDGASPTGDRPFLARFDVRSAQSAKVFESAPGRYEEFVAMLDRDVGKILIRSESPTDFPNFFIVDAERKERVQLTSLSDPTAGITGRIQKRLLRYRRGDGVELSGTLYLPPEHMAGKQWPLFVWAYPREFDDPSNAGQVRGSPLRYTRVSGTSALTLVLAGYALLDNASMPIVGPVQTANDTFVEQLVANAKAAIDACVAEGVAEPGRVAIGGHSYGAFMTANLLAHSDLFRTGIARSGAYNRTLTPFGFQNEERTYWQAPEIYFQMSPFMHAQKIDEPILLIHGQADNNPGTFPMQSERLFAAIKGHGGRARLVTLPFESHGYQAHESVLHVVAEMVDWLDRHLK